MTTHIDETHDPARLSWVASANGHRDFPLQNLALGVFTPPAASGSEGQRGGVAIGDMILDLRAALATGLFIGSARDAAAAASAGPLNAFMALGAPARQTLRQHLFRLLAADTAEGSQAQAMASALLHRAADCTVHLPAAIGAYTDFYAGIHHATNAGKRRSRDEPLFPNYKYVPVAYHSRASSVQASGAVIRRPNGQRVLPGAREPSYGRCEMLDFELEFGVWIGPGNVPGETIPIGQADAHIAGFCLLNDCSARDIQNWEAQPLGPFLAKNFGTTVSPWLVTPEALAPFRMAQPARPAGDPRPLPYLWDERDQREGALDLGLEVLLQTERMRAAGMPAQTIARSGTRHLYWTVAQMVTHHACGGCNLQPGDLFGSGTISADVPEGYGSIRELADVKIIELPTGEQRRFLEDGDEVIFRASAARNGYASIGFGENRCRIAPALPV